MQTRVPHPVSVDYKIDLAIAVDIGQEWDVTGDATEPVRCVRHSVVVEIDRPQPSGIGDDVGDPVSVHVGDENALGGRLVRERPVGRAVAIEVEIQLSLRGAVQAEVERKAGDRGTRAPQRRGECDPDEGAGDAGRQTRVLYGWGGRAGFTT